MFLIALWKSAGLVQQRELFIVVAKRLCLYWLSAVGRGRVIATVYSLQFSVFLIPARLGRF